MQQTPNPPGTQLIRGGGGYHRRRIPETQGDVLIRGLWEIHTDAIIDVRFRDSDMDNYVKEGMHTLLPRWE